MVGEGTRGGRERRGRDRVRGGQRKQGCYTGTKRQWGKGGLREGGLMIGTSEEGTGRGMGGGREEASGEGLREERMEQGSKEMKLQGRYPEYTVYSHPIPQRALAIATLLLQMKNS